MPGALALIPLLLEGLSAAEGIKSLTDQPSAPKPATPSPQQVTADATKTRSTQEAALSQTLPGLQAQTGGSLSPETLLQLAQVITGQGGEKGIGAAVQDLLQKVNTQGGPQVSTGSGLTLGGFNA